MTGIIPAEWSPHRAMWVGWPSHEELWEENLAPAQDEVEALVRALAGAGRERVQPAAVRRRDQVVVAAVQHQHRAREARQRAVGAERVAAQRLRQAACRFNGWGGKYELAYDDTVATQIGEASGVPLDRHDFILEGGALDHGGDGTILTTRQCVLNPNRNRGWDEAIAEAALIEALAARRVVWLGDGLLNDHTDGHVDNLARFVAPGVVACPIAFGIDDPNAGVYDACAQDLAEAGLDVVRIPSPGRLVDEDGAVIPASHMNFLIANGAVILPTYGNETAVRLAVEVLADLFPDREVIALPSRAILTGGGSFHCTSQQEPE